MLELVINLVESVLHVELHLVQSVHRVPKRFCCVLVVVLGGAAGESCGYW